MKLIIRYNFHFIRQLIYKFILYILGIYVVEKDRGSFYNYFCNLI